MPELASIELQLKSPIIDSNIWNVIREGEIKLELRGNVFYNPSMSLARDLNISCCSQFRGDYLDVLAGTGVSGMRVAKELGLEVSFNDKNPRAVELIHINLKLNGIRAQVFNRDANALMHEIRAGILEIDPFGSPVEFIDSGLSCAKEMMIITATDTAPLCGVHRSGMRRYSALIARTQDHPEIKLRVLLGYVLRQAAKLDKAIIPILSVAHSHFVKLWIKLESGARRADAQFHSQLGYIHHCNTCQSKFISRGLVPGSHACCGTPMQIIGPVYLGSLHSKDIVAAARDQAKLRGFKQAYRILDLCFQELDEIGYYQYHELCSRLKLSPIPMDELIQMLRSHGFMASRVHSDGRGFKTNAPIQELIRILS